MKYKITQRKGRCVQVDFGEGWVSSKCWSKQEAIIWANNILAEKSKSKSVKFSDYAFEFYTSTSYGSFKKRNERRNDTRGEEWYTRENCIFNLHVMPKWKNYYLNEIKPNTIEDWFTQIEGKDGSSLSQNYKNKILYCLSHVLGQACVDGYIDSNPCDKVQGMHEMNKPREAFTEDELKAIFPESNKMLDFLWGKRMWAIYFLIMRDTGFRPGEIAGLKKSNFFKEYNGIYTEQSVNTFDKKIVNRIKTTGDGFRYKVGILSDRTSELLQDYISTLDRELIFLSENGNVITTCTSNKRFKECVEMAQIELRNRTQYCLRTTFMTYKAGVIDSDTLKDLMGHKQWRMCYDRRTPEMVVRQMHDALTREK